MREIEIPRLESQSPLALWERLRSQAQLFGARAAPKPREPAPSFASSFLRKK